MKILNLQLTSPFRYGTYKYLVIFRCCILQISLCKLLNFLVYFLAISSATSVEKNKLDYKDKAIRSAATWNSTFNRSRRDHRRCCFDLQSFTIHYPRNKLAKTLPKEPTKPGSYPLALIPGQYTDFYKR